MSESTPRVTAPFLERFTGDTVRILGKVLQLRGEHATIDAGGSVNVLLSRVSVPCLRAIMLRSPASNSSSVMGVLTSPWNGDAVSGSRVVTF